MSLAIFFLGSAAALLFLGAFYIFALLYMGPVWGKVKNLVFLQAVLSFCIFFFSVYFFIIDVFASVSLLLWALVFVFMVWSVVTYYLLDFSRSFGFKNTPYFQKVALEKNVSGFFGSKGYSASVPAGKLLSARLVTSRGRLSPEVTLEHLEKKGHIRKLRKPRKQPVKKKPSEAGKPSVRKKPSGKPRRAPGKAKKRGGRR